MGCGLKINNLFYFAILLIIVSIFSSPVWAPDPQQIFIESKWELCDIDNRAVPINPLYPLICPEDENGDRKIIKCAVVCDPLRPEIDGVISPGEWDSHFLGTSVTGWEGGMSVDVYGFADNQFLYAAYVADTAQPGWNIASILCIPVNLYYRTPQSASWPDKGYTLLAASGYPDYVSQTDGTDWVGIGSFAANGIDEYLGDPCYNTVPNPNVAEVKIPLSLLTYAGNDGQVRLSGQYWQYVFATLFYASTDPFNRISKVTAAEFGPDGEECKERNRLPCGIECEAQNRPGENCLKECLIRRCDAFKIGEERLSPASTEECSRTAPIYDPDLIKKPFCTVYQGEFTVKNATGIYEVMVFVEDDTSNTGCIGTPEPNACEAYTAKQCRDAIELEVGCNIIDACEGTPTLTCRQLGANFGLEKCEETDGCEVKQECTGTFRCSQIRNRNLCSSVPNCRAISFGNQFICVGSGQCSSYQQQTGKCDLRGCTFQQFCDGTPAANACEEYDLDQCAEIPGCETIEECTGTPDSCKEVGIKLGIQKCLETKGCEFNYNILQNEFNLSMCILPVPRCGDLIVQPPETCDPPGALCQTAGALGICDNACQCQVPFCGDGSVDPPEQCDPPGSFCTDPAGNPGICDPTCGCITEQPYCGNLVVEPGELCDPPGTLCIDPFSGLLGACTADCGCRTERPYCGNLNVEPPEECDPPGLPCIDPSGQHGICTFNCGCTTEETFCGDKIVQPPEQCDPPGSFCKDAAGNPGICDPNCGCRTERPYCGNLIVEPPESCDPPNSQCINPFTGQTDICDPNCGCPDIEVDDFPNSKATVEVVDPSGARHNLMLNGPTTVHVSIGPNGEATDTDGDGLDQVPIEIVSMQLTGAGGITLELRDPSKHPYQRSLGEIEETVNTNPGTLDVPPFAPGTASSFFDVFFEIDTGTGVLHNDDPKHMQSVITHKPPAIDESYTNALQTNLMTENDEPSGFTLQTATHIPKPSVCGDGNKEGNEQCDDGNIVSGDGCDSNCQTE